MEQLKADFQTFEKLLNKYMNYLKGTTDIANLRQDIQADLRNGIDASHECFDVQEHEFLYPYFLTGDWNGNPGQYYKLGGHVGIHEHFSKSRGSRNGPHIPQ
jgi:hypothetical protein